MRRMKTNEEFRNEVYYRTGNEYTVLGNYEGSLIHIIMRHNTCGHEYKVTPNAFLNGNRCPECYGFKLKTHDQFVKEVFDLVGSEYTVLSKYKATNTKITMKHNKCCHIYEVRSNHFLSNKSRCPKCYGTELKSHDQFVKEVFDLVGDEYTVLGQYITNKTKIKMKHNKCGHEYDVKPNNFLSGTRCPKCSKKRIK